LIRQETRGSHWREDFPETSTAWEKRIVQQIDEVGNWATEYAQVINK
jgi:L-aspartate oxidase